MDKKIAREIHKKWKPRKPDSHKGDFGRVLVVAGSRGLTGAAHLSAMAALRTGAGLVTLAVPDAIYQVAARREAEVMVRPFAAIKAGSFSLKAAAPVLNFLKNQDVLAVGPGLSQQPETMRFAREIARKSRVPVVLDADGINAFKGRTNEFKYLSGRAVLTPHSGEFKRVFGPAGSGEASRIKAARMAAKRFGIVMILKGHRSVVAGPDGKVYINSTGNPGMATGGTGDVLTGMIAALIGQKFSLWDAARFAVYLHGLAGDRAAKQTGQTSLVAGDILDFIAPSIKKMLGR